MDYELLRSFSLSKKLAEECFPFDNLTPVYKVCGKMFALVGLDKVPLRLNLKCDPENAIELRERYESITPGWHMNKKHWVSVELDGSLDDEFVMQLIADSYNIVVAGLKKSDREKLI